MLLVAETPTTETNLPTAILPTTNLRSTAFTVKPDVCGEKPATSSLVYCSTYIVAMW